MNRSDVSASKKVIYAALAGNLLVALTKYAAAAYTGSSSMFSEAIHSLVDTGNECLLLYGYRRSIQGPDDHHPLGYGRELYFWSFIVALLVFAVGAGVALYQGVSHIWKPQAIENVGINYAVLALSAVFEGASWWLALKRFSKLRGRRGYWQTFVESRDPPSFMVLFEDTAALLGIVVAAAGIFASVNLNMPILDGVASIIIGLILALTASLLARESKELIIGERASDEFVNSVLALANQVCGVDSASAALTVHLAPDQIVVALSLEFDDALKTPDIEKLVITLEKLIREQHPEVVSLFIKPQTRTDLSRRKRFAEPVSHLRRRPLH
jgi:cation diffusion facilitator family transporter